MAAPNFELVAPQDLKPHPRNPRKHTRSRERIIRNIRASGWHSVITVQRSTGYIVVGHGRREAAMFVIGQIRGEDPEWTGWAADHPDDPLVAGVVPVEYQELTDAEAIDKVLGDNKASDEPEYDEDLVTQLLMERWAEGHLDGTGWTEEELKKMQADDMEAVDDLDPSPQMYDYEYRVVIQVPTEAAQAELLERFTKEGLDVRALTS